MTHTHTPPSLESTAWLSHKAFHHTVTHICCPFSLPPPPSQFSLLSLPPLQPSLRCLSSFATIHTILPFLRAILLPFHANKSEQNSSGQMRVEAGGPTRFYTTSHVLRASDGMLAVWKKGHRVVSIHLRWLKARRDFFHVHTGLWCHN